MAQFKCIVVTPEDTVTDTEADFVALPLYDGEVGIAPGHGPMIGRLGYGELRLKVGESLTRYYLDGGFVQVDDGVVSVLTSRAILAEDLKEDEIQQAISEISGTSAAGEEAIQSRERQLQQARAQLQVARKK
jgi:F-type H+-transporting ATPase subunit epsilon